MKRGDPGDQRQFLSLYDARTGNAGFLEGDRYGVCKGRAPFT